MPDIKNELVFVTGSTKGIGKAIAEKFIEKKARVIIHGRNYKEVQRTSDEIGAFSFVIGDLSCAEGFNHVMEQLAPLGEISILINNAGIFSVEDFFNINDEQWLHYFQVNVMSAIRLCRAIMPTMLNNNYGRIINIASEAAIKPLPQMIHYSMTKTALVSISRGLAELTKGSKVTVNSLLPGPTWTEGVEHYFNGLAKTEGTSAETLINNYFAEHEPTSLIQRFINVEEIADAVLFLTTNAAVNGSALRAEGGVIRSI